MASRRAATKSVAPGATLLRASRIFSIPPPLPRPTPEYSAVGNNSSDTATLPYPIYMSITTPQSSLIRGDWGLKRPLPLRSTMKSTNPVIRLEAMDTFEHITEYGSAADHTFSLQKWQEMDIPITTPAKQQFSIFEAQSTNKSVFEDKLDCTTHEHGGNIGRNDVRWKFDGPWLAGQTEGEFNEYMFKEVRRRKPEFRRFLKQRCAEELRKKASVDALAALEHHEPVESLEPKGIESKNDFLSAKKDLADTSLLTQSENSVEEPTLPASSKSEQTSDQYQVSEEILAGYIKDLRQDRAALFRQIRAFLDLPPVSASTPQLKDHNFNNFFAKSSTVDSSPISESPYGQTGPPKTHPSAGISYTRSAAKMFNHPLFGPQKYSAPVEGRVVMPKGAATGNFNATLGVGGFVTNPPSSESTTRSSRNNTETRVSGLLSIELDKKGGSKLYVQPKFATVDPKGRILLTVDRADSEAIAVKEEKTDELHKMAPPQKVSPVGEMRHVKLESSVPLVGGASMFGL